MDEEQGLIKILPTLAHKLKPIHAFVIVLILVLAWVGGDILPEYRALVYVLAILVVVGYLVDSLRRLAAEQGKSAGAEKDPVSVLIEGVDPSLLHRDTLELDQQLRLYLEDVKENYGKITLRGVERGGKQVVELDLEQVYVPLKAVYDARPSQRANIESLHPFQ